MHLAGFGQEVRVAGMLVRSGVDAQRIEHVEGYADRRPKLPNDPAAAQNRRIEILIREKRP